LLQRRYDAKGAAAVALISEANKIIARQIVKHERDDETKVNQNPPSSSSITLDWCDESSAPRDHSSRATSRKAAVELSAEDPDRYLIRDAQRVIEFD